MGKVRLVGKVPLGIGGEVPTALRSGAVAIASNAAHRAWASSLLRAMSRSAALETAMLGAETLRMETLRMETLRTETPQMGQR